MQTRILILKTQKYIFTMKDMKTLKKIKIVKSAKKLFHRSVAIGENLWLNKSILTTKDTKKAKF